MIDSAKLPPVGGLLRGARLRMDLTLKDASGKLGIHMLLLRQYEVGERYPSHKAVRRLATFYGLTLKEVYERFAQEDFTSERSVSAVPATATKPEMGA